MKGEIPMKRWKAVSMVSVLSCILSLAVWYPADARSPKSDSEREYGSGGQIDQPYLGREDDRQSGSPHGERDLSSARHRWKFLSGEIERVKKVKIRGTQQENLAVLVFTDRGNRVVVDLGPINQFRDIELRSGDYISARGPVFNINGRLVMFAKELRADEQTVRINRAMRGGSNQSRQTARQVSGEIEDIKELKVKGTGQTHQVARLRTPDGNQIIADLGAKKDLKELPIKNGTFLLIEGQKLRLNGKPFVLAEQVTAGGRTKQIDRQTASAVPASKDAGLQQGAQAGRSTSEEMIVQGEIIKIDRDGSYVVQEPNGRRAHIFVVEGMDPGFDVGDQIQARVSQDGSVTSIAKLADEESAMTPQQ